MQTSPRTLGFGRYPFRTCLQIKQGASQQQPKVSQDGAQNVVEHIEYFHFEYLLLKCPNAHTAACTFHRGLYYIPLEFQNQSAYEVTLYQFHALGSI